MNHQEQKSLAESIALLSESERAEVLNKLTDDQANALLYDWEFWARPSQLPPKTDWVTWLLLAGRGFGKTRVSVEQLLRWEKEGYKRFAIVAQTPAEARDVIIEGESGILACSPPDNMPNYEPSKRRVTWKSGAIATVYSGENPELLRGPQHEKAIVDELAKYRYPQETWDNLMFGLRLGDKPQVVVATTPKPIKIIKELIKDKSTSVTRGSTYENRSNLAETFIQTVIKKYENTRLGRQELYAEILDDNPNALWNRKMIDEYRVQEVPDLVRIVVGVDPAVTSGDSADDTGIIAAGIDKNEHGYILDDKTLKATPNGWAKEAINSYYRWKADRMIGEANNGGDMIEFVVRSIDRNISYRKVYATKGKLVRAEPIASLYEQGRIHHVGYFSDLEDQYCEWQPGEKSPNNMDAAVWALTELFIKYNPGPIVANI